MFGLFGKKTLKKCDVCGKETKKWVTRSDGMMFCCLNCRTYCEKQEEKGKPIAKGKVCEYC